MIKRKTRGNIRHYRGYTLHSDLELDVMKALYLQRRKLKKAFSFSYESEILPYSIEGSYTPDYIITVGDHKIYVEVKGYLDDHSRRKMLAVRKCHPDLDIRFLFEKNNKIRKTSKMKYLDWAERNGFQASVGRKIPIDWLF